MSGPQKGEAMTSRIAVSLASLLVMLGPAPGSAAFNAVHITEVMSGVNGDPGVQYVEIRMYLANQTNVTNTRLTAFSCDGSTFQELLLVPGDVPNGSMVGLRWIMATTSFAAAAGITPDFTWDPAVTGSIPTPCGMVCWGAG